MFAFAAKRMGYGVVVLDPTPGCPASQVSDRHIVASLYDAGAIADLARATEVLTYEFEHVNAAVLQDLGQAGFRVRPSGRTLMAIQDKHTQKSLLQRAGLPVPRFLAVEDQRGAEAAADQLGLPLMLKSRTGGYDGKGNALIERRDQLAPAWAALSAGGNRLMAEEHVRFEREVSVVLARGLDRSLALYPVAENEHQDNILRRTRVPADLPGPVAARVRSVAGGVMEVFEDVGVFCVEMFLASGGEVLINEVAPRTHNSGHYTIEACRTSQFEQHLRCVTGLPLGPTTLLRPAAMANILGQSSIRDGFRVDGLPEILRQEDVHFHFYGKQSIAPHRKIGHITALGDTAGQAEKKALAALSRLDIRPWPAPEAMDSNGRG